MASGQSAQGETAKSGKKNRTRLFVAGGVALLLVGLAGGAGLWRAQSNATAKEEAVNLPRIEDGKSLLPIGRITVNVSAAVALGEKKSRFLLIEPTVVYAPSFDQREGEQTMPELLTALRDSFIEYLSQLHEDDVYGSAGLAELRGELLRRARVVTQSDAPMSILLQDFVLQ